jgi:hypothetical protein
LNRWSAANEIVTKSPEKAEFLCKALQAQGLGHFDEVTASVNYAGPPGWLSAETEEYLQYSAQRNQEIPGQEDEIDEMIKFVEENRILLTFLEMYKPDEKDYYPGVVRNTFVSFGKLHAYLSALDFVVQFDGRNIVTPFSGGASFPMPDASNIVSVLPRWREFASVNNLQSLVDAHADPNVLPWIHPDTQTVADQKSSTDINSCFDDMKYDTCAIVFDRMNFRSLHPLMRFEYSAEEKSSCIELKAMGRHSVACGCALGSWLNDVSVGSSSEEKFSANNERDNDFDPSIGNLFEEKDSSANEEKYVDSHGSAPGEVVRTHTTGAQQHGICLGYLAHKRNQQQDQTNSVEYEEDLAGDYESFDQSGDFEPGEIYDDDQSQFRYGMPLVHAPGHQEMSFWYVILFLLALFFAVPMADAHCFDLSCDSTQADLATSSVGASQCVNSVADSCRLDCADIASDIDRAYSIEPPLPLNAGTFEGYLLPFIASGSTEATRTLMRLVSVDSVLASPHVNSLVRDSPASYAFLTSGLAAKKPVAFRHVFFDISFLFISNACLPELKQDSWQRHFAHSFVLSLFRESDKLFHFNASSTQSDSALKSNDLVSSCFFFALTILALSGSLQNFC